MSYFNSYIGLPFNGFKDRISKQKLLEREMIKKHKLNKNNFRISIRGDCVICEYIDKDRIFY
jgi:hypothetical protein